jgi:FkbM family methyltransferase
MKQFITYAQNREDVILAAFFKDVQKGVYVDVGAFHPVNDSVTKHFYDNGWRGINIEPIASLYKVFASERTDDINIQAAISNKSGNVTLREYKNKGLSTVAPGMQLEYKKAKDAETNNFKDVEVAALTLKDVFEQHPQKHIHFLKVDVEGFEYEALEGNDWKKYRPEMLCVEANHPSNHDVAAFLATHNYEKVYNDGLNDYYLAKESKHRAANFSYVDTMLLSEQIIPYHVVDKIESFQKEAKQAKSELAAVQTKMERAEHDAQIRSEVQRLQYEQLLTDLEKLQKEIIEQQRFRNSLRLFLKASDRVILTQIERLHVVRKSRVIKLDGSKDNLQFDAGSPQALLASIREADMKTYFSTKKQPRPKKFYLYRILHGTYSSTRHGAGSIVRAGVRTAKGAKQ